jgi:hypothetical protein
MISAAIISSILGLFGGALPSLLKIWERKQDHAFELKLTDLKLQAAKEGLEIQSKTEDMRGMVDEGKSLRDHDLQLDGGKLINQLKSSIRPVVTYLFVTLFFIVKVSVAVLMFYSNAKGPEILATIWDEQTIAIFFLVLSFWFGSRATDKFLERFVPGPVKPVAKKSNK